MAIQVFGLSLTDFMHCSHDLDLNIWLPFTSLSLEPKTFSKNVQLLIYFTRCTLNAHNNHQVGFLNLLKVQLCYNICW